MAREVFWKEIGKGDRKRREEKGGRKRKKRLKINDLRFKRFCHRNCHYWRERLKFKVKSLK